MVGFLGKMTLNAKMTLGFGVVIFLLVVGGIVGIGALMIGNARFDNYANLSNDATLAGDIQYRITQMRRTAAKFRETHAEEDKAEVHDNADIVGELLTQAQSDIKDPDRAKVIDELETEYKNYIEAFDKVVGHIETRDREVAACNVSGPEMEKDLTAIMHSAYEAADYSAVYNCGTALRALLLGRIYMIKYLDTNSETDYQRSLEEFDTLDAELQQLDDELQNPERRALRDAAAVARGEYVASMKTFVKAIEDRNELQANVLNNIGSINAQITDMKEGFDVALAEMAEDTIARNNLAMTILVVIVFAAVILGVIFAIVITKSITAPLVVLADAAHTMSQGDFTVVLAHSQLKDPVGIMTEAFIEMKNHTRDLIRDVAEAATSVASSSEELSAGADETSRAVQQVANTIQEVAKGSQETTNHLNNAQENLDQNARAIEGISRDIEEVAAFANQAAAQGEEGRKNANEAADIIGRAAESVKETATVVNSLGDKTAQIGEFIGIITGIADQTNLLALNAAIEAARAGEAGRGFAVVAEEVRKLAEESNTAAGNITELVKSIEAEMQSALTAMERSDKEVAEGVKTVSAASEMLGEIVAGVQQLSEKVQNVSAAAEEINASTGEVVDTVHSVSSVSEENAAASEEVSSATEEQTASMEEIGANANNLAQLAEKLQELVSAFKVDAAS